MQLDEQDYAYAIEYIKKEQFRGNSSISVTRKGDTIEAFYTFGSNPPHLMARWMPEEIWLLRLRREAEQELFIKTTSIKR